MTRFHWFELAGKVAGGIFAGWSPGL